MDLAAGCLLGPLAGSTWCSSSVLQRLVDTKCSNFLLVPTDPNGEGAVPGALHSGTAGAVVPGDLEEPPSPTQLSGGSQLGPWLPQAPMMSAKPTPLNPTSLHLPRLYRHFIPSWTSDPSGFIYFNKIPFSGICAFPRGNER